MTTAIRVNNISKRYKIGAAQGKFRYGMLRETGPKARGATPVTTPELAVR